MSEFKAEWADTRQQFNGLNQRLAGSVAAIVWSVVISLFLILVGVLMLVGSGFRGPFEYIWLAVVVFTLPLNLRKQLRMRRNRMPPPPGGPQPRPRR